MHPASRHPGQVVQRVESERKECARAAPRRMARRPHPPSSSLQLTSLSLYIQQIQVRQWRDCRFCTARPFRRNGVAVPAQRHHRSGATPSPFRRNGIAVPAQRHRRSGATASPFRRNGITVPARRRPPSRPRRQNGGARHRRTRPARRGNLNENVRIVAKRTREIFSEASHHACILPRLRQKKCAAHRPIAMKAAL